MIRKPRRRKPKVNNNGREFGRRLAALRLAAGLSQGDLGELVGLTRQAISRVEVRGLEVTMLERIARALGVDVGALVALRDETTSVEDVLATRRAS